MKLDFVKLQCLALTPDGVQQLRILLAELDGTTPTHIFPIGSYPLEMSENLPNYPEDYNELRKVEDKLTDKQWISYLDTLVYCDPKYYTQSGLRTAAQSTSLQRCIALIHTLQA